MAEKSIEISSIEQLSELFGSYDENIKILEKEYDVSITSHNETVKVIGDDADVEVTLKAINALIMLFR